MPVSDFRADIYSVIDLVITFRNELHFDN